MMSQWGKDVVPLFEINVLSFIWCVVKKNVKQDTLGTIVFYRSSGDHGCPTMLYEATNQFVL